MKSEKELKEMVKEKYGAIAEQTRQQNQSSCCGGGGCCSDTDYSIMSEDYTKLPGYVADADLALGCGMPTKFARIMPGDTVVDLGSGAGNDCFVARSIVGETGRVIGLDMTQAMIDKASENARKKNGGNFSISDIVLKCELPEELRREAVLYAGCISGAIQKDEYIKIIQDAGFKEVAIQKERKIDVPEEIFLRYLSPKQLQEFEENNAGIFSVTVFAERP